MHRSLDFSDPEVTTALRTLAGMFPATYELILMTIRDARRYGEQEPSTAGSGSSYQVCQAS